MPRPDHPDFIDDPETFGVAGAYGRPDALGKRTINTDIAVMRVVVHVFRFHYVTFDVRTVGMSHHPLGARLGERVGLNAYVGNLSQLFFVGEVDGAADHHVGGAHGVGDDGRHPPGLARVGAFAPEDRRSQRNIAPNHRGVGAPLDYCRLNPSNGLLIDDVDAAVEAVVGGDDQDVHTRLDLGAVVDHVGDGNRSLFGDSGIELTTSSSPNSVQSSRFKGSMPDS